MMKQLKKKLKELKSKIHKNRGLLGNAASVLLISGLFAASELGLLASALIGLGGLAGALSQITDPDEDRLQIMSNGLILNAFLVAKLLGSTAGNVVMMAAIVLMVLSVKNRVQNG